MKTILGASILILLTSLSISCGSDTLSASPAGPPTMPPSQVATKVKINKDHLAEAMRILENKGPDAAVAYAQSLGQTAYDLGINYSMKGTLSDGLKWFNLLLVTYNDPLYLYGKAWILWAMMETEKAYSDAEYIVTSETAPPLIKARAYYLLALIDRMNGEIEAGLTHVDHCAYLYNQLNKNGGLYLAYSHKARLTLLSAEEADDQDKKKELITLSRETMDLALEYNGKLSSPYDLGDSYKLDADIYFLQADYPEAILAAQKARKAYTAIGREKNALFVYTQIGLIHALMGRVDEAHAIVSEISQIAADEHLNKLGLVNNITRCYMRRCRDIDYQGMRIEIIEWSNSDKEGHLLLKLLSFVESVNCW